MLDGVTPFPPEFAAVPALALPGRPQLRFCLVQGKINGPNDPRFVRLEDLLAAQPRADRAALAAIRIDPAAPARRAARRRPPQPALRADPAGVLGR